MARRKTLRERNPITLGIVGLVAAVSLVAGSVNLNGIRSLLGETTFSARFSDSGGSRAGDAVRIDGVKVGTVSSVSLVGQTVEIKFRAGSVRLGDTTTAMVKSENALGSKYLAIEPGGSGSETQIPLARTDPGYAVSEVLGRLTSNTSQIDVAQVTKSFTSLTKVLKATPPEFRAALQGVSDLSQTISSRDAELGQLLQQAGNVSGVLARRSDEIISLITAGNSIFTEIGAQRQRLEVLFAEVGRAADEITQLVNDNRSTIGGDLTEIKHLAKTLNDYRGDLGFVLTTLPKYARSLGEAVGSGPFFQAYIPNLTAPESLGNVDSILASLINSNTTSYIKAAKK